MLTCPKCGAPDIPSEMDVCPACGENLKYEKMLNRSARQKGQMEKVCVLCGERVMPRKKTSFSVIIFILLLMLWIIPGLLYLGYCMSKSREVCPNCGGEQLVPINSPAARRIIDAD